MSHPSTLGIILAGGLARRLGGGDKTLHELGGQPILAHIVARLRPQLDRLVLNANGDPARLARFGLPILPDTVAGHPGPLAGILAGLESAAAHGFSWVVSVPADAPFLPLDLVGRLHEGRDGAPLAVAASAGRTHPVVALWPVAMGASLRAALAAGQHKVGWATDGAAIVVWPDTPVDPFFNVNTPADLAAAQAVIADSQTPRPPHPAQR